MGYQMASKPLYPEDLFKADQVLLTNALMGCVLAVGLNGRPLASPDDLADRINGRIFERESAPPRGRV
jgi:branched-subunit amino acid aminotransferase/4-amino-4-deoxychorismate lyase